MAKCADSLVILKQVGNLVDSKICCVNVFQLLIIDFTSLMSPSGIHVIYLHNLVNALLAHSTNFSDGTVCYGLLF